MSLSESSFTCTSLQGLADIFHETEPPGRPDLLEPHILRSLSNVKAVSVHTSHSACHCVVLDADGAAWMFGRNERSVLGVSGDVVSENAPRKVMPQELGAPKGTKFVYAACGRSHTLLVGSEGQVWTAGVNNMGQVREVLRNAAVSSLIGTCSNFIVRSPRLPRGRQVQDHRWARIPGQ